MDKIAVSAGSPDDERLGPIAGGIVQPDNAHALASRGGCGLRVNAVRLLDERGRLSIHAFAVAGYNCLLVCRNYECWTLENFGLDKSDAALVHEGILDRSKPNRNSADQSELDGLPRLVQAVLQPSGLVRLGNLCLKLNPIIDRLLKPDGPDRLVVLVLPQERQRVLE